MMFEDADTYDFGEDNISVMSLLEVWVDVVTREYSRLYVSCERLLDCTDL